MRPLGHAAAPGPAGCPRTAASLGAARPPASQANPYPGVLHVERLLNVHDAGAAAHLLHLGHGVQRKRGLAAALRPVNLRGSRCTSGEVGTLQGGAAAAAAPRTRNDPASAPAAPPRSCPWDTRRRALRPAPGSRWGSAGCVRAAQAAHGNGPTAAIGRSGEGGTPCRTLAPARGQPQAASSALGGPALTRRRSHGFERLVPLAHDAASAILARDLGQGPLQQVKLRARTTARFQVALRACCA